MAKIETIFTFYLCFGTESEIKKSTGSDQFGLSCFHLDHWRIEDSTISPVSRSNEETYAEMGDSWLKCYKMLCILYYSNNKMKKYWSLCSRSCTLEKERDKDNHLHSLFFSFGSFHSIKCDILWISFMILLLISSTAPPLISLWWASE